MVFWGFSPLPGLGHHSAPRLSTVTWGGVWGAAADARAPRGPSCIRVLGTCGLVGSIVCVCQPGAADTLLPRESGRSHAEEGAQALCTSTGGENSLLRRLEWEGSKSRSRAERRSLSSPPPLSRTPCASHLALRVSVLSAASSVFLCSLGGNLALRDLLRVLV